MRLLQTLCCIFLCTFAVVADDVKKTETYKRIRAAVDAVPAIDTHDHLRPFDQIAERDVMPSDRIMWGADTVNGEGIYAATQFTRQCLSEALAEKVIRGELREDQAIRIGGQVMRENALKLFPKLRRHLWKDKISR